MSSRRRRPVATPPDRSASAISMRSREGTLATIPLNDLRLQHAHIRDEVARGWERVCHTGIFVLGEQVEAFEQEFARYHGRKHCVAVGSGTDALEFGLRAVGLGPGDEVAVPTNSFAASAFAVLRAGGRVRFVDVDVHSGLAQDGRLAEAAADGVFAVMPVHLYGQVCPLEDLGANGSRPLVVEDAAQAHGATRAGRKAGTLGEVAAMSFHASKNLGAYGDGGAVLTDDDDVADQVRRLRSHGEERKYRHVTVGGNSRLDELQAVVLRAKLRHLDNWNHQRREAAARYAALLADVDEVVVPTTLPDNEDVWHLYVVRIPNRDVVFERLRAVGVMVGMHYPVPIHNSRPFAVDAGARPPMPAAERRAGEILSLPLYPGLTQRQQERVVNELINALTDRPAVRAGSRVGGAG